MDERTVSFYDEHARELAARYESADMSHVYHVLTRHLPERGSIFEIDGGTGRDAAFLLSRGHDVTSVDASAALVSAALEIHPELRGRLHHSAFPLAEDSELLGRRYDAVVTIATLMHVPDQELFGFVYQTRQLLRQGGAAIVSTSTGRTIAEGNRDADGRLFRERPPEEIRLLFERVGFRFLAQYQTPDSLGRDVLWHTLVFQLEEGSASRSVDQVETIVRRDRKDATYKLALLRALCDIARAEHRSVEWRQDGRVAVPLGLIAEKWLLYYWPLVEPDRDAGRVVFPQKRGRERTMPIAFRAALLELVTSYPPDALPTFYRDYRSLSLTPAAQALTDRAINKIARAIVAGPVRYAGGALDLDAPLFVAEGRHTARHRCSTPDGAERALGRVLLPGAVWRELCLIGHWISESILLRWADLTSEMSKGEIEASQVVDRLLVTPTTERDVEPARTIYLNMPSPHCVWTDRPLRRADLVVDHVIPFSVWLSNDLWNLVPTSRMVNADKSDKLVTRDVLLRRRDSTIHCWEVLWQASEVRFAREVGRALARADLPEGGNWQAAAFSGLVESVETLSTQRGIERWTPSSRH